MTNQIKFTREYDPAYLGAEGWGDVVDGNGYAENPFFACANGYDLIIDNKGVSLYIYDPEGCYLDGCVEYAKFVELTYDEAKAIAVGIELMFNRETFLNYVKNDASFEKNTY
jgi:hypothetical protein